MIEPDKTPAEDTESGPHAPPAPIAGTFQSVPLDAFVRHRFGAGKADQYAGFLRWAKKAGHARHSTPEWEALLDQFHSTPIG